MNKKKKKILIILVSLIILIIIAILVSLNVNIETEKENENNQTKNVIIPEEEISDEQLRETTILLYFVNSKNEICNEMKKIDSKLLINNPYQEVMNILLTGPSNSEITSKIPNNTKINKIEKNGECLFIDLSKEFVDNQSDNINDQKLAITQIVKTMTQFNEINSIKILIDGKENQSFKNNKINFGQLFTNNEEFIMDE